MPVVVQGFPQELEGPEPAPLQRTLSTPMPEAFAAAAAHQSSPSPSRLGLNRARSLLSEQLAVQNRASTAPSGVSGLEDEAWSEDGDCSEEEDYASDEDGEFGSSPRAHVITPSPSRSAAIDIHTARCAAGRGGGPGAPAGHRGPSDTWLRLALSAHSESPPSPVPRRELAEDRKRLQLTLLLQEAQALAQVITPPSPATLPAVALPQAGLTHPRSAGAPRHARGAKGARFRSLPVHFLPPTHSRR
jgi:hypothetical protein